MATAAHAANAQKVASQAWMGMGARLVMRGGGSGGDIRVTRLRSRLNGPAGGVGAADECTYRRSPRKAMESSATVPMAAAARPGRQVVVPPSPPSISSSGAAPARPGGRWKWAAGGAG